MQASGDIKYFTNHFIEISELMGDADSILVWDEAAAVNYLTYDNDQWISFDTNVTFKQKVDFANSHCLGGVMVWAVDQDTYDWEALSALLGEEVDGAAVLQSGEDKGELASAYSAYTGADCYVTGCFDYNKGQCKNGYSVLDYVHSGEYGVIQKPDDDLCDVGDEGDGQYRLICCPTDAMPQGCLWGGDDTLYGDGLCAGGTSDFCGNGKFELIQDGWTKRTGGTKCVAGAHSLCCNTNPELDLCSWTSCMGTCPTDLPYSYTYESEWEGPSKHLAAMSFLLTYANGSRRPLTNFGKMRRPEDIYAWFNSDILLPSRRYDTRTAPIFVLCRD